MNYSLKMINIIKSIINPNKKNHIYPCFSFLFYTFEYLSSHKNIKKCKINSRNFTYDGLTFSTSSLVLEVVKDEI